MLRRRSRAVNLDEFIDLLASRLDLDGSQWKPESRLEHDLGLDSLQLLEVVLLMDEQGFHVPEEKLPHIGTISELYALCTRPVTDW